MKTYYFNDDEDFVEINTFLDSIKKNDEAQIYINSWWWKVWMFQAISDRLNRMIDEWFKISIRCIFVASRAFRLFYDFKGKKILEYDAEWLAHVDAMLDSHIFYVNWDRRIREDNNLEIWRNKTFEKQNPFIYPFFTEEEKELYLQWRNVYLSPERMEEIFANK